MFLFRTGVAILDLSWHYIGESEELPAQVVLEGNYLLSHGNHPTKSSVAAEDGPAPLDAHRLLVVVRALLPDTWTGADALLPDRLQLYSLVRVQRDIDEGALLQLGIRLSHRQTSDYRPKSWPPGSHVLQPFSYLCHVLAPEGAASVIASDEIVSGFSRSFVPGIGANTYVPMFVASLHNHLWLLAQTEWLPARVQEGKRHQIQNLEEVYERAVEFRRFFYFPMVSRISLHNAFYECCEKVFKIIERQRFLEQTTRDIAELLKTRRNKWIGRISGAAAGFLVGHELLGIVSQSGLPYTMPNLRVWLTETAHASPATIQSLARLVERWDLLLFLGSLLGAVFGYWLAWNFDKSPRSE